MTTPTASSEGVRNALATRAEAGVAPQEQGQSTAKIVTAAIDRQADAFRAVLPEHVDPERFARLVLTAVKATPKLMECFATQQGEISVLLSAMQAAALGLEPNTATQEAWLLPRNVKVNGAWVSECELSIGYRGYMKLAKRSGTIVSIFAEVVREKDTFVFKRGLLGDVLEHEVYDGPDADDPDTNPMVRCYAVARYTNGTADCRVTTKAEVLKRRQMSTSWSNERSRPYSPWTKWPEAMWRKTAVRALVPYLDLSAEIMEAHTIDERPIGFDAVNRQLRVIDTPPERLQIESGEDAPEPDPPPASVEHSPDSAPELLGDVHPDVLTPEGEPFYTEGTVIDDDPEAQAEEAGVATGKALIEARKIAKRLGVDPPTELADVKGTAVGRELAEWFRAQTSATAGEPQPEVDPASEVEGPAPISDTTRKRLFATFGEVVGGNDADQKSKMLGLAWVLGETNLKSRTEITEELAQEMLMALDGMKQTGHEIVRQANGSWTITAVPVSSAAKSAARKRAATPAADQTNDEEF